MYVSSQNFPVSQLYRYYMFLYSNANPLIQVRVQPGENKNHIRRKNFKVQYFSTLVFSYQCIVILLKFARCVRCVFQPVRYVKKLLEMKYVHTKFKCL